ncbi:hypothetical protein [Hymenobacter guriensis]|uniref:2-dehydro-3-deoxyphosphooctonate aldolase n=1 Tax=Hymenobacter guriensis TaxID=2793065 RepID=A0ABS0L827_9BACT|nr:hypothetical protein [Hymenobacter guriensis]MBG8556234.1 2-dehydro-3-deoxyphosphooctonate aldolase [Hymenobacter guriensis]
MKRIFYLSSLSALLITSACKTTKPAVGFNSGPRITGSTSAPQSYYDAAQQREPAQVSGVSTDADFGITQKKPVCVAGISSEKVANEHQYLNALRGPNGEKINYRRRGSCCGFETPNGIMGYGLLDVYELTWEGSPKPLLVYINMYDSGPLLAPVGLTLAKP